MLRTLKSWWHYSLSNNDAIRGLLESVLNTGPGDSNDRAPRN